MRNSQGHRKWFLKCKNTVQMRAYCWQPIYKADLKQKKESFVVTVCSFLTTHLFPAAALRPATLEQMWTQALHAPRPSRPLQPGPAGLMSCQPSIRTALGNVPRVLRANKSSGALLFSSHMTSLWLRHDHFFLDVPSSEPSWEHSLLICPSPRHRGLFCWLSPLDVLEFPRVCLVRSYFLSSPNPLPN